MITPLLFFYFIFTNQLTLLLLHILYIIQQLFLVKLKFFFLVKPNAVTGFDAVSLNAHSIEIKWVAPSNIKNPGILLYKLDYCAMVNTSGVITKECYSNNYESRDSAYELKGLKPNTLYLITVTATNQGVVGEATNYTIRTPAGTVLKINVFSLVVIATSQN